MRIVFIGAAGCGKSTLAASIYSALKASGRDAEHVTEWIRSDIQRIGPMTSIWEQYRTRQYQKELEDAIPSTVKYVVCDSGTLTPFFYANLYVQPHEPRQRIVLQDMYRYLIDDLYLRRYDLIFYLPPITSAKLHDGTRYQTNHEISVLDAHMRLFFTQIHPLPEIHSVGSGVDQRLEEVMWKILAAGETDLDHDELRLKVVSLMNKLKNTSGEC